MNADKTYRHDVAWTCVALLASLALASLPADLIHQPWENPLLAAKGKYPSRIVRHEEQRAKCLAMFKAVRK